MAGPYRVELRLSQLPTQLRADIRKLLAWVSRHDATAPFDAASSNRAHHNPASVERAQDLLDGLDYDFQDFDPQGFAAWVAEQIERDVRVQDFDLSTALSGALVRTQQVDWIFYNRNRHRILQAHIITHELGHLLLGHDTYIITQEGLEAQLATLLNNAAARFRIPDTILPAQQIAQEIEAEAFARFCMTRVKRGQRARQLQQRDTVRLYPPFSAGIQDEQR